VTGAPQYTLRIKDWKAEGPSDAFSFNAPPGAKKIALGDLADTDEIPRGTVTTGGKK
jgi:hypothetical protein